MLIDIEIDFNKVNNEIEHIEKYLKENHESEEFIDISRGIVNKLNKIKGIESFVDKIDIGIYEGCLDYYKILDYFNVNKMERFDAFNYIQRYPKDFSLWSKHKQQYGTCDNVEQILDLYEELKDETRKFTIIYHKIKPYPDEYNPKDIAFHNLDKHGEYIGEHEWNDLVYNTEIEELISYDILEILN